MLILFLLQLLAACILENADALHLPSWGRILPSSRQYNRCMRRVGAKGACVHLQRACLNGGVGRWDGLVSMTRQSQGVLPTGKHPCGFNKPCSRAFEDTVPAGWSSTFCWFLVEMMLLLSPHRVLFWVQGLVKAQPAGSEFICSVGKRICSGLHAGTLTRCPCLDGQEIRTHERTHRFQNRLAAADGFCLSPDAAPELRRPGGLLPVTGEAPKYEGKAE